MTVSTFPSLGVSEAVSATLAKRGITTPFPIQALVMADAMAGRDVLAKSRTGSGKTLAFAIPIVERLEPGAKARPAALVLVPTRELAAQVVGELGDVARARGLRVAAAYGGVSITQQAAGVGAADILVATPGRLEDLCQRKAIRLDGIRILILDEADRMLDMGFEPQVAAIVKRLPAERQTMFFSATLDGAVGALAARYTARPSRRPITASSPSPSTARSRRSSISCVREIARGARWCSSGPSAEPTVWPPNFATGG